jgi:hypothetical protein
MFVEIVTAPGAPGRAMMRASASSFRAFSTSHAHARRPQPRREPLRFLDADRAHEDRTAGRVAAPDLLDHRRFLSLAAA